jgi:hypothetical protein
MEAIYHNNFFSQQHEKFTRRKKWKGRGRGRHVVAPHVGLSEATTMSIKGAASPITTPLTNVIRIIRPLHQRQSNWDHAKVFALIKCKNNIMLISNV